MEWWRLSLAMGCDPRHMHGLGAWHGREQYVAHENNLKDQIMKKLCGLSATRKADRAKIADAITEMAAYYGAMVERVENDRDILLSIKLEGVGASIWIKPNSGSHEIISWHNDYSKGHHSARDFSPLFMRIVGDTSKPHHKATSLPGDWDSLLFFLSGGLQLARQGRAFGTPLS